MSPQQSIAHYRILSKLGQGGMGEVWRATDTKLNRDVAIKILPETFAADRGRLARFSREAQILASLNHPNIAAVYGVEERVLVMELVNGATLADRVARGPIPFDEAVPIARQLAEALEYAHERGVVHRDLKPANVKITTEGRVKVLDFGLAKAMSPEPSAPDDGSNSPTLMMTATVAGTVLGTPAYMSPEQAKGMPVDRRADIWAFGIVVLEMLTGKRAYTGQTTSEILAAVMMKDADFSVLPAGTPPHVVHLLRRCLARDPLRRLRDIGEARIALESSSAPEELTARPVRTSRRGVPLWAAAVLAGVALSAAFFLWRDTRSVSLPLMRFSVDLGPEAAPNNDFTAAIAPDGRRLVYLVRGAGASTLLATRLLDQAQSTVLPGTENARQPFFRPDSQWIGFFADGKLKKVSVHGGAAVTLCEAVNPRGAWWGEDGAIVATLNLQHPFRIPESGDGQPQPIGKAEDHGDRTWRWPQVLPGGQDVLVTASAGTGGYEEATIEVVSVKTGRSKTLLRGGYFGRYLPSGHLIYIHQAALLAVPFDLRRLETRGAPVPILNDVSGNSGNGAGELDFSQTGTLVYLAGPAGGETTQFVWLDSAGKALPLFSPGALAYNPKLSPDGKRLAVALNGDIVVHDLQRDSTTRLTFRPDAGNRFISWMPDGKHIVFGQGTPKPDYAIWWVRSDGSGQPEKLFSAPEGLVPSSVSPDGRSIAFSRLDPANAMDIWTLPLDLSDPDHPKAGPPEPFVREPGIQWDATFSPDGRWVAYTSSEAGPNQVFVRAFPAGRSAGKWQISNGTGGSRFPVWSRKGTEIFYLSSPSRIMVATYTVRGESFAAGKPSEWSPTLVQIPVSGAPFDMSADGRRAVISPAAAANSTGGKSSVHVTVLLNFFDELKRRLP